MKKIIFGLVCLLGLNMVHAETNTQALMEEALKIEAKQMNKSLPRMINSKYRYEEVKVENHSLVNIFTLVGVSAREIDISYFRKFMEADLQESICNNADIKEMFKQGLKFKCVFVGKDRERITELIYDAKDCTLRRDKLEWNGYFNY